VFYWKKYGKVEGWMKWRYEMVVETMTVEMFGCSVIHLVSGIQ
jgi:hypothetical protein